MSLRDKLKSKDGKPKDLGLFKRFGILTNPFPSSSQSANNPHRRLPVDDDAEARIVSFLRDGKSQVVVIEGTQGVGKTNFLSHFEAEIQDVLSDQEGYYVVRYLADPEASFDGTIRRLFQELGTEHLDRLAAKIREDLSLMRAARNIDFRSALTSLVSDESDSRSDLMMEWLLGLRLLKAHREQLGVQFRLDTVESKTAALRDLVLVSSEAGILKGIFLLLDELEKQDGVLGPTAVVRYLSAMRAIIDSLPNHLFMMLAVTPDAMRRYSVALPAFRSRLQNQITLSPLSDVDEALQLAQFYLNSAKADADAKKVRGTKGGQEDIVTKTEAREAFEHLRKLADRRGDVGVRQREYLHQLHRIAEDAIQDRL
ncbi:hypothetical protein GCM10022268_24140 [Sphingomonas cynarae]|uniref:Orc1-like AAA ATPase domain-containing protein n=1 Tax=Sphingomonas cynarae TaxID=930197 RepID=A0ABP7E5G9_9SPHN